MPAAEIHIADEHHGHDDHEDQGDHLAPVRLAGHESAAAVALVVKAGVRPGVDAADAERHEEPERGMSSAPRPSAMNRPTNTSHTQITGSPMPASPSTTPPSQRPSLLR